MKLLVEPSRELPLVQIAVAFQFGAAHDPPGKEGLGRMVGRMLRRCCRDLSGEQIEQRLDALGCELGVQVGLGATVVGCEVLGRNAEAAAELIGAIVAEPRFDALELAKLKRQVEAEIIAARDDDAGLSGRALRRHLFAGHAHGRRLGGSIASARAIEEADLWAHYRRGYGVANAVVAIGGDSDETRAGRLAAAACARLPQGELLAYPAPEPTPPRGRRLCLVDKPERSQCQLAIGSLGSRPSDDDHAALAIACTAFGGTFSSRLNQEVRVKRGWSYGASAGLAAGRVRDAFTIWSAPAAHQAADCLRLSLDLFERFCDEGIREDELSFCRDYLRRSYAFEIDTGKKRLQQRLERALLDLPDDFHDRWLARLGAVALEDANRAIARRLDARASWVAVVATDAQTGDGLRAAASWQESVIEPFDAD